MWFVSGRLSDAIRIIRQMRRNGRIIIHIAAPSVVATTTSASDATLHAFPVPTSPTTIYVLGPWAASHRRRFGVQEAMCLDAALGQLLEMMVSLKYIALGPWVVSIRVSVMIIMVPHAMQFAAKSYNSNGH